MTLVAERHGDVLVVTLNRPEQRNALDLETIHKLLEVLEVEFQELPPAALVLTGAGNTFSAGIDMGVFGAFLQGDDAQIRSVIDLSAAVVARLMELPCLTVAALNGAAVGPGMALALAADLRVVTERAKMIPGFFRFGGSPDGGTSAMMVRAFGVQRTLSMSVTDAPLGADQLVQLGVAERVVGGDELLADAVSLADALKGRPAESWPRLRAVIAGAGARDVNAQLELEREYAYRLLDDDQFKQSLLTLLKR